MESDAASTAAAAAAASEVMPPAGHAGSCHSGLVIDEVLENIMLWMGQWERIKVAALVCEQWTCCSCHGEISRAAAYKPGNSVQRGS